MGGVKTEVMLDSGSLVSPVREQMLSGIKNFEHVNSCARHLKLMTALGAELPVLGHIRSSIRIGEIEIATHITLQTLVQVRQATVGPCLITPLLETPVDAVDECAVPDFLKTSCVKLPECAGSEFSAWMHIHYHCQMKSRISWRNP